MQNITKKLPMILSCLLCIFVGFVLILKNKHLLNKNEKNFVRTKPKQTENGILLKDIDELSGFEFESFLAILFTKLGFVVYDIKNTKDFGADLIIEKNKIRYAVQAKHYSKKVGIKSVQEVVASKAKYSAEKCLVITNNFFTKPAIELAYFNGVILVDRFKLFLLINLAMKNDKSFGFDSRFFE